METATVTATVRETEVIDGVGLIVGEHGSYGNVTWDELCVLAKERRVYIYCDAYKRYLEVDEYWDRDDEGTDIAENPRRRTWVELTGDVLWIVGERTATLMANAEW